MCTHCMSRAQYCWYLEKEEQRLVELVENQAARAAVAAAAVAAEQH